MACNPNPFPNLICGMKFDLLKKNPCAIVFLRIRGGETFLSEVCKCMCISSKVLWKSVELGERGMKLK